jgi:hypothetical protein
MSFLALINTFRHFVNAWQKNYNIAFKAILPFGNIQSGNCL